MIQTIFSHADLTDTSFVASNFTLTSFNTANLLLSDFSLATGRFCDFFDVDFTTVEMLQTSLHNHSAELDNIHIPDNFFDKDTIDREGFQHDSSSI